MPGWSWQKNKPKLSNPLRLNFCYSLSSAMLSPKNKIKGDSKKCTKNKYFCLNEDIWLMTMKVRLTMKNRSHRYDVNRPRPRHGHKLTKYETSM